MTSLRNIPTWPTQVERGTYEVTPFEFGDTCPLLQVSKKHGVDYGDLLLVTHQHAFGEKLPGTDDASKRITMDCRSPLGALVMDMDRCILRMERLYRRVEYGM